jgi:hypothetical protein
MTEVKLPKRVLDLNILHDDDCICLRTIEHDGDKIADYASLSYCWGSSGEKAEVLTKGDLAHRRARIPVTTLSKTLQDAIAVTRHLGIRYLWVDALCITQEDESDWATESAGMGTIYAQAKLTIVASCSSSKDAGFLRSRPHQPMASISNTILTSQLRNFGNEEDDVSRSIRTHWSQPIQNRAWALQERLLSSRAIFYNSDQLLWECQSRRYLESLTLDLSLLNTYSIFEYNVRRHRAVNLQVLEGLRYKKRPESESAIEQGYRKWYTIVSEFTRRDLTYDSDALPAMSSLAKTFSADLRDVYMAGIWQKDLCRSLSWYRVITPDERLANTKLQAIEEIFAPSWSWASLSQECSATAWSENDVLLANPAPVRLIESNMEPSTQDPTGRMRYASLSINGLCRNIKVSLRKKEQRHPFHHTDESFVFTVSGFQTLYLNQWVYDHIDRPGWLLKTLADTGGKRWTFVNGKVCKAVSGNTVRLLRKTLRNEKGGQLEDKGGPAPVLTLPCLLVAAWRNEKDGTTALNCLLLQPTGKDKQLHRRVGLLLMKFHDERLRDFPCLQERWERKTVTII